VINAAQMREIVTDTLTALGSKYADPKAIDLIYNTGLVESKYVYLKQIKGPARGYFQMEPFTAMDICTNYLQYRDKTLKQTADVCMLDWRFFLEPKEEDWQHILTSNLYAQICMTRMHYRRVPKPLPRTIDEQAVYWKSFYNTHKGKGTPQHFAEIVSKYG
tara:strand:+ start:2844 stop:3326 length:483 start_codon:yes stop_codon:yes gene_type:complete